MTRSPVEHRIARLERVVRLQRLAGAGLAALFFVQCGAGPAGLGSAFRVTSTDAGGQLELLDEQGRPRVVLSAAGDPRVALVDASGNEQVVLAGGAPSVTLRDGDDRSARVSLAAQPDGGVVMSCDPDQRCAQLFAQGERRGVLMADGARKVRLLQSRDAGELQVEDGDHGVRAGVRGGEAGVEVSGGSEVRIAAGRVDAIDEDGVVRARVDRQGTVEVAPTGVVLRPLE